MSKYEPYKFDNFQKLVQHCYGLAWYQGTKPLLTIRMLGAFEGWSGRASETWEHRFALELDEPRLQVEGKTIDEVCRKAVEALSNNNGSGGDKDPLPNQPKEGL